MTLGLVGNAIYRPSQGESSTNALATAAPARANDSAPVVDGGPRCPVLRPELFSPSPPAPSGSHPLCPSAQLTPASPPPIPVRARTHFFSQCILGISPLLCWCTMRTVGLFSLFALLALLSPCVCFSQSPTPLSASSSAAGTVLLSGDDRPVPQARVELYLGDSGTVISTFTDDNGQFRFAQLAAATYVITVTSPDCELFQLITSLPATAPLVFRLRKVEDSPPPRNDSVVSIQELAMPRKAVNAFQKGTQLLLKGDLEGSLPYFRTVIELAPSTYRPYHNLGLALYRLGQLDAAAENFQKSIDLTNGGFSPSIFGLSMILYQRADYRQAEFLVRRGLLVTPYSAIGKYCLGLVQFSLGRIDDAQRSALEAFSLDPHAADVHVLLARIYERQHNPSAVLTEAETYLKLEPHGPLQADALDLLHHAQLDLSHLSASLN